MIQRNYIIFQSEIKNYIFFLSIKLLPLIQKKRYYLYFYYFIPKQKNIKGWHLKHKKA